MTNQAVGEPGAKEKICRSARVQACEKAADASHEQAKGQAEGHYVGVTQEIHAAAFELPESRDGRADESARD